MTQRQAGPMIPAVDSAGQKLIEWQAGQDASTRASKNPGNTSQQTVHPHAGSLLEWRRRRKKCWRYKYYMEDIELPWKRQLKLEKTEILSYHKLGGILFAHPPHPSHKVGCSQEQDQFIVLFPNLFHFNAERTRRCLCRTCGKTESQGASCPHPAALNTQTPLKLTTAPRASVSSPQAQQ